MADLRQGNRMEDRGSGKDVYIYQLGLIKRRRTHTTINCDTTRVFSQTGHHYVSCVRESFYELGSSILIEGHNSVMCNFCHSDDFWLHLPTVVSADDWSHEAVTGLSQKVMHLPRAQNVMDGNPDKSGFYGVTEITILKRKLLSWRTLALGYSGRIVCCLVI